MQEQVPLTVWKERHQSPTCSHSTYECVRETSNKGMSTGSKANPLVTERCHNCRRRRLRCDRSVPSCQKCIKAGQECLGYGKLFRWNQGIASRGKMMGKSYDVSVPAQPEVSTKEPISESSLVPISKHGTSGYQMHNFVLSKSKTPDKSSQGISIPPCLLDPLVQDMSSSSRYYLSHCNYNTLRKQPPQAF